jgi:hypothetical protein
MNTNESQGQGSEVANATSFLAFHEAQWMTGVERSVNRAGLVHFSR